MPIDNKTSLQINRFKTSLGRWSDGSSGRWVYNQCEVYYLFHRTLLFWVTQLHNNALTFSIMNSSYFSILLLSKRRKIYHEICLSFPFLLTVLNDVYVKNYMTIPLDSTHNLILCS